MITLDVSDLHNATSPLREYPQNGDVIIATVKKHSPSSIVDTPMGWTRSYESRNYMYFSKVWTGIEPDSVSFSQSKLTE